LFGVMDALEEVDVFHVGRLRIKWDQLSGAALIRPACASASADYGGHQTSLKLRLAARSINESWWRWRESNPRPKTFSK
jgi:hypothetical protein